MAIEPLLSAVEESGVAVAGGGAMEEVLFAMEGQLEALVDRAEQEAWHIDHEARRRTNHAATESRHQVALMRKMLVERASTLAHSFQNVLGMLDDAERALADWENW